MPRVGLDVEAVVAAAVDLADSEGLEALTLVRLGERLGVRSPSLYAHVDGLEDLRRRLAARAARQLAERLQVAAVGRAQGEALAAIAEAYVDYARRHPGAYAALQRAPRAGDEAGAAAAATPVETVLAVLRGYGLEGEDAIHAARILRAALHGFVSLEAGGGFALPVDVDETFARLLTLLDAGLAAQSLASAAEATEP